MKDSCFGHTRIPNKIPNKGSIRENGTAHIQCDKYHDVWYIDAHLFVHSILFY